MRPFCVTAACDLSCAWCECCGGPGGGDFAPDSPEQPSFPTDPTHFRLVGGDPFRHGDLRAWVAWARRNPAAYVSVEGHAHRLLDEGALARLLEARPDAVRVLLPALDDAAVERWTGRPLVVARSLAAMDALLAEGLHVVAVVALNDVTAPRLQDTVTGLAQRFQGRVPVVLLRAPVLPPRPGRPHDFPVGDPAEQAVLGEALESLPAALPFDAPIAFDALRNDPPCLLPPGARRPGMVTASKAERSLESTPAPSVCGGCAWRPRCAWRPAARAIPTHAMAPLSQAEALAMQATLESGAVTRVHVVERGRRRAAQGLPDLLCFAPFTSLSVHELRKRPVPCAQSWVDTTSTPEMEAEALGVPVEDVVALNARAQARWGVPWHDVMNEDWPLREIWNAPLLRHMRGQMVRGGPSDRCRSSCRVVLGVEERGTPFLTRPDAELSAAVVANRRLLLEELRAGRSVLSALPLDLCVGVSSHCNISCGFCTGPMGNFGELSDRRFEEVVAFLPTLLHFSAVGPGEPLMSAGFTRLLDHIAAGDYPSLTVSVTTNGTLLRQSWIDRYQHLRWGMIRVSLNAGTAATYERMTGKTGYFERVIAGLEMLAALRDRTASPFELVVSCVLTANVQGDLAAFAALVDRLGARIVLEPMTGDLDGNSPYKNPARTRDLAVECHTVADGYAVQNPPIARAFNAMAQFAEERLRKRLQVILPRR